MKEFFLILTILAFSGCGLIPAYRRAQPDYMKTSHMMISGGSRRMVKSDWGEPAKKDVLQDGNEVWTYENRQDGKTFIFYFDKSGRLIQSQICKPDECK